MRRTAPRIMAALLVVAGAGGSGRAGSQPVPDPAVASVGRLAAEQQARLARDVESFGRVTAAPDALILAARFWAALGATQDRDRALDLATRAAGQDADLLRAIAAVRAAGSKGVLAAAPISLAPGEQAATRSRVASGGVRARVTASLPVRIRLTVSDGKGAILCSATGEGGGAECGWTAPWEDDVTLSVANLGEDRLSAWTITRSADKVIGRDEGIATWR